MFDLFNQPKRGRGGHQGKSGTDRSRLLHKASRHKTSKRSSHGADFPKKKKSQYAKAKALLPRKWDMSRKKLRQLIRGLKKKRRTAYHENQEVVPTIKNLLKEEVMEASTLEKAKKEQKKLAIEQAKIRLEERKVRAKERQTELAVLRAQRKEEYEEEKRKAEVEWNITQEDNEIKILEKQLNLDRRKKPGLPKSYAEEGLTYILDAVDPTKFDGMDDEDGDALENVWKQEQSDDEGDKSRSGDNSDDEGVDGDSNYEDLETDDVEEDGLDNILESGLSADEDGMSDDEDVGETFGGERESDMSGDEDEGELFENEDGEIEIKERKPKGKEKEPVREELKEDIYGRLRDAEGNVVKQAYVPPAKRIEMESLSPAHQEQINRLSKQLKGHINRLSESNMVSICSTVEQAYRANSKADVTATLYKLVSESCLSNLRTPERLSQESAMLIALLHNKIGSDIGAKFIETAAQEFNSLHSSESMGRESKKLDNVVMFIGHLYLYSVIDALLITDLFHNLTESFKEKDVELLLVLLRAVGFTLRRDDPVKLKEIIIAIQRKANAADLEQFQEKSRIKFMLDVLLAIKNNNVRKIPNYDDTHIEHLKKTLRGLLKLNKVDRDSRLRISLSDLLHASSKGKWWVVGSAWQGQIDQPSAPPSSQSSQASLNLKFSKKLLELAKQNRMNSEVRRNVFCTVMTSEDYLDAHERLNKLGLSTTQEREIMVVCLECCCNERTYNGYYTYLIQRFILDNRKYQFLFRTSLWDKLKSLKSLTPAGINNLAALTCRLIHLNACSITVFKTVEFAEINKPMVKYLKAVLNGIFKLDKYQVNELFYQVGTGKMKGLREGLELFILHFIRRKLSPADHEKLDSKIEAAVNGLSRHKMVDPSVV